MWSADLFDAPAAGAPMSAPPAAAGAVTDVISDPSLLEWATQRLPVPGLETTAEIKARQLREKRAFDQPPKPTPF